jgi:hypothetical protein
MSVSTLAHFAERHSSGGVIASGMRPNGARRNLAILGAASRSLDCAHAGEGAAIHQCQVTTVCCALRSADAGHSEIGTGNTKPCV